MHIVARARAFVESLRGLVQRRDWEWRHCPVRGSRQVHRHDTDAGPPSAAGGNASELVLGQSGTYPSSIAGQAGASMVGRGDGRRYDLAVDTRSRYNGFTTWLRWRLGRETSRLVIHHACLDLLGQPIASWVARRCMRRLGMGFSGSPTGSPNWGRTDARRVCGLESRREEEGDEKPRIPPSWSARVSHDLRAAPWWLQPPSGNARPGDITSVQPRLLDVPAGSKPPREPVSAGDPGHALEVTAQPSSSPICPNRTS